MPNHICATCGIQYPDSDSPPEHCIICEDDRQYIGLNGQQWTTLDEIRKAHSGIVKEEELNLYGIGCEPRFAIGQRALLVQSPQGNILWDCLTFIDDQLVEAVKALGGISSIAISHPHYYGCMIEWSHAFGGVPIYIHEYERQWVVRPDPVVRFWSGDMLPLSDGRTLIRCGGHFPGGMVMHWAQGAEGRGVLLTGDIINVVQDRRYVSFMHSFPNLIPLNASAVQHVVDAVAPYPYDRIYSAWFGNVVKENARAGVEFSAARYIQHIQG